MKIGIVTLWNTESNYGGIIQTFALQQYLRNQGHDAYIIRVIFSRSWYCILKSAIKDILISLKILRPTFSYLRSRIIRRKDEKRKFREFLKSNVSLSTFEYHSMLSLRFFPPQADCYITGSDQVWAMPLSNPREAWHYLDFGASNIKRISYAASFGHDTFPEADREKFVYYASKLDRISVREESGIRICKSMGFEALRCVDSTLLLDAKDYQKIMAPRKFNTPYAYIYSVNMSSSSEIYWRILRKELIRRGILPVVTTASGYMAARELFDDVLYDYSTPTEWLSNLYYSSLIITSSFHGIAFSLIFRKQFVYFPLLSSFKRGNDRITDLLKLVGLEDRIVYNENDCYRVINTPINYDEICYDGLDNLIKQSKQFLAML